MTPQELYQNALDKLIREGVRFKLRKEIWFLRLLDKYIYKKSDYIFISTLGNIIAIPEDFWNWTPAHKYVSLIHEAVHVKQYRRLGLGSVWLGWVVFAVLYILCLPTIFTLRSVFEREAYEAEARAMQKVGLLREESWCAHVEEVFVSWPYFFMCPFPQYVERWAHKAWRNT